MATFKKVKLGEIVRFVNDKIETSKISQINYVSTENLLPNKSGIVNASTLPNIARVNHFLKGDVIFSNIRTYFKKVWFSSFEGGASNDILIFRPLNEGKLDKRFLYYIISNDDFIDFTVASSKGTKMPRGDKKAMNNFLINLLPINIQKNIVSVLSAYDDLIKSNEKRIKVLEEVAQLLYEEWFVRFKFPGHEKVKMVDSGTKFGMIPEGWKVVQIDQILDKVKRRSKLKTNEYQDDGLYPVVDQGSGFIGGYTNNDDLIYKENLIVFGDHSRCFKYCNFQFACGADGTQLLKTNDRNRMPQILLYYSVINAGLQNYNYARHFKFLKTLKIIKPDSTCAQAYDKLVGVFYDQIKELREINIRTSKMRDLLIPQLVTGKRELK